MSHLGRSQTVAVIGATGFVGSAIVRVLTQYGHTAVPIVAPRLQTSADSIAGLRLAVDSDVVSSLADQIRDCPLVINAAGLAQATSGNEESLLGANALLPLIIAEAIRATGARFLHISSAAVQGSMTLDESTRHAPFSPYSTSKSLGERVVEHGAAEQARILRPTSVHGQDRRVTRSLARLARSPFSTVAAPGDMHTPQVHVDNVAHAAMVAVFSDSLPEIILQPSEGWTTREFMETLGCGVRAKLVPRGVTTSCLRVSAMASHDQLAGWHRRLEMLWHGQEQEPSSLQSLVGPVGRDEWRLMAQSMRLSRGTRHGG